MVDNNEKKRIIEKIKKLLALAKDKGATTNEAATAARQAETMMRRYNLEMGDVITQELKNQDSLTWGFVRSNMFKNNGAFIKKVQDWPQWIAVACSELYDCHVSLRLVPQEGHVIAFFGYEVDVSVCCWVYEYLLDCVRRASLQLTDAEALAARVTLRTYRTDFRRGMASELTAMLREAAKRKKQEDQQSSSCTALVIAKRQAVEQKYGAFEYGSRAAKYHSAEAMVRGQIAGRKTNINPNPVTDQSGAGQTKKLKG